MDEKQKSVHCGHRDRMREKAIKYGFESFHYHEILEMLLYPVIPQKDTNPIAHDLINTFGSFHAVFEADVEQLASVKGMTKNAAYLIKTIPAVSIKYLDDVNEAKNHKFTSIDELKNFFIPKFIGASDEKVFALFLNTSGMFISCELIASGTVNAVEINSRKIIELCIHNKATQIVLCHNHPSGNSNPSMDDFIATKNINLALKAINAKLVDHFVVVGKECISMKSKPEFIRAFM